MTINLNVKWYQWLFGIFSFILLVFLVHESFGTFAEGQPQALGTYWLIIGIPLLISLYLTFGLRWTINRAKQNR